MHHDGRPLVSIIIPCRNEEKFIGGCLDSIISSDYPKDRLEVFVVDGMSEDGTRGILAGYSEKYPFIKLLENIKRITPCAFNIGIRHAAGEAIMIMGMHATYEKDYISKCVRYLDEYGADNVGGVMVTVPRDGSLAGKAITLALSHRFGVGNSVFRTGAKEPVFVDTVFGGCYKRDVFRRVGMFNEALVKHQDMEFNCRLREAGGRILLAPDIVCYYYARTDIRSFLAHNWGNGLSVVISLLESRAVPVSSRHFVPMVFVSAIIFSSVFSVLSTAFAWLLLAVSGSYSLAALYNSGRIGMEKRDLRLFLIMPAVFALLHISYGLGSLYGAARLVSSRRFWSDRVFAAAHNTP